MIEQLETMIAEISKDIRRYQVEQGALVVANPASEASKLLDMKVKLQKKLRQRRGW